jgi:DNA mismatch repair ATPase MutS
MLKSDSSCSQPTNHSLSHTHTHTQVGYKFKFFGADARIAADTLQIMAYVSKAFHTASIPAHRVMIHAHRYVCGV